LKTASLRITSIAGSLRKASINRALLVAAQDLAPEDLEIKIIPIDGIPLYNGDLELEGVPASVTALRQEIEAADGLLIATPEYNSGIPGVLKNTLDWLSRPPRPQAFEAKPVGLLGATPGGFGTRAAQFQLRQCLAPLNACVMAQPQMLVRSASTLFDEELRLTDEKTRERLLRFLTAFGEWVRRVGG